MMVLLVNMVVLARFLETPSRVAGLSSLSMNLVPACGKWLSPYDDAKHYAFSLRWKLVGKWRTYMKYLDT